MARTMDSPNLRKLPRTQIQSIAKRELVRAVGKTEDIIRRLVKKHPDGVPVPSARGGEPASQPATKRNVLRKLRKGLKQQSPSEAEDLWEMVTDTNHDAGPSSVSRQEPEPASCSQSAIPEQTVQSQEVVNTVSHDTAPADRSVAPTQELATTTPAHAAEREDPCPPDATSEPAAGSSDAIPAVGPSTTAPREPAPDPPNLYTSDGCLRAMDGPDENMVVDALREFTTLVNTMPIIESRILEAQHLLDRATSIVQETMPDLRESCMVREHLELFLLGKMKKKRELWDGTAKMRKQARKLRVAWLRAARKAENVRRWEEENESYAERGLSPEPYEYYASESEGEIIESLQTTPASSICGSPKRVREDFLEIDGGRRKRCRS